MKLSFLIASALLLLSACHQSSSTVAKAKDTPVSNNTIAASSSQDMSIPYRPMYTTDFVFGDYKHAQTVFNLWKHYDDNDFTADDYVFADTISMDFPNGSTIVGKDSLNNAIKKYRASLVSAKEAVISYVVLHPKSTDDTWVCIWGNEADTYKNGKTDTTWMNENWKFNRDGKVAYISQYAAGKNISIKQ